MSTPAQPKLRLYAADKFSEAAPVGYVFARAQTSDYSESTKMILPVGLIEAMKVELEWAQAAKLNAETRAGDVDEGVNDEPSHVQSELCVPKDDRARKDGATFREHQPLKYPYQDRQSQLVTVYARDEIEVLTQAAQTRSKSEKVRYEDTHKRLKAMGHLRHLLYPACQGQHLAPQFVDKEAGAAERVVASQRTFIQSQFNALRERFPHFGEVIEIYQTSALAAARTGRVMSPPPVLMLGVPGVGKTHFAQAVAECLGLPMLKLGFDTGLTNSALLGSDQHWSNTHHGQLFEYLCLRQVANPIFFLDELDKASTARGASGHQSALSALHSCLEPSSAGAVKDISFGITMDASHVTWLAATNDADSIVSSLRSRFTEVTIRPPVKPEQMYQLNWHICKAVVEPLGVQMPKSVIRTCLAVLSPREQRKHLEAACQAAFAQDRDRLEERDFAPGVIESLDEFGRTPNGRRNVKRVGARSDCDGEMLH